MTTFRNLTRATLLGLTSLTVAIAPAIAAPCRGPNGRFIKCSMSAALSAKPVVTHTALPPVKTAGVSHNTVTKTAVVDTKAGTKAVTTVAPKKG
jgi:hypothetical protein